MYQCREFCIDVLINVDSSVAMWTVQAPAWFHCSMVVLLHGCVTCTIACMVALFHGCTFARLPCRLRLCMFALLHGFAVAWFCHGLVLFSETGPSLTLQGARAGEDCPSIAAVAGEPIIYEHLLFLFSIIMLVRAVYFTNQLSFSI